MTLAPEYNVVGKRLRPANAVAKGTGAVKYTADINLPGMLWVKAVRSPHPRARIVKIDASEALAMPGVVAVLTYENIPDRSWGYNPKMEMEGMRVFSDHVDFVGDPVAAVAADDPDVLEDAVRTIRVEYEVLPPILSVEESARPDAVQIHEWGNVILGDAETPTAVNARGDVERGFAEADVIIEHTYRSLQSSGIPHEPRGAVASWDGDRLTVWDSTQQPFTHQKGLAQVLDLPEDKIRVISTNVVGGFGTWLLVILGFLFVGESLLASRG